LSQNQITEWKKSTNIQCAEPFFGSAKEEPGVDITGLHAKTGQLTLENYFLEKALTKEELLSAKKMIART